MTEQKEDVSLGALNVVHNDMRAEDLDFAIATAREHLCSLAKGEVAFFQDVAAKVKESFDTEKGGTWHVVVGRSFGSFVTNETRQITHFMLGSVSFLIWKHL